MRFLHHLLPYPSLRVAEHRVGAGFECSEELFTFDRVREWEVAFSFGNVTLPPERSSGRRDVLGLEGNCPSGQHKLRQPSALLGPNDRAVGLAHLVQSQTNQRHMAHRLLES